MARSIHLRFAALPSGLASYPRMVLVRRPPIDEVRDPPEFHAHVERAALDAAAIARFARACEWRAAGAVPPTYPHVLAMPLHLRIFAADAFPLRPMGLIHVANRIELLGKLAAGATLAVDVALRAYRRSEGGLTFDVVSEFSTQGRALWRETSSFLSRRPAAKKKTAGRPARPPKAPAEARVLAEIDVSLLTAWNYARVSSDFNPIHLSDPTARLLGLRGAISHGMWSLARLLAEAPGAIPAKARIDAQFLSPVGLPSRVVLKEWMEGDVRRRAMCDSRTGRVQVLASVEAIAA